MTQSPLVRIQFKKKKNMCTNIQPHTDRVPVFVMSCDLTATKRLDSFLIKKRDEISAHVHIRIIMNMS